MEGTVKWYNVRKGYGFIAGDDGEEYFVHFTAVPQDVRLNENDRVSFDPAEGEKGKQAQNVSLSSGEAPAQETPAEEASEESSEEAPAEESAEEPAAEESSEESSEEEAAPAEEPSEEAPAEESTEEPATEDSSEEEKEE